jgi:hypothetical protein
MRDAHRQLSNRVDPTQNREPMNVIMRVPGSDLVVDFGTSHSADVVGALVARAIRYKKVCRFHDDKHSLIINFATVTIVEIGELIKAGDALIAGDPELLQTAPGSGSNEASSFSL